MQLAEKGGLGGGKDPFVLLSADVKTVFRL